MNTLPKLLAASGLAATVALSLFAASPASAKAPVFVRHAQRHKANLLDRRAAHATATGHYRRAARLERKANHLRTAARHGY